MLPNDITILLYVRKFLKAKGILESGEEIIRESSGRNDKPRNYSGKIEG